MSSVVSLKTLDDGTYTLTNAPNNICQSTTANTYTFDYSINNIENLNYAEIRAQIETTKNSIIQQISMHVQHSALTPDMGSTICDQLFTAKNIESFLAKLDNTRGSLKNSPLPNMSFIQPNNIVIMNGAQTVATVGITIVIKMGNNQTEELKRISNMPINNGLLDENENSEKCTTDDQDIDTLTKADLLKRLTNTMQNIVDHISDLTGLYIDKDQTSENIEQLKVQFLNSSNQTWETLLDTINNNEYFNNTNGTNGTKGTFYITELMDNIQEYRNVLIAYDIPDSLEDMITDNNHFQNLESGMGALLLHIVSLYQTYEK